MKQHQKILANIIATENLTVVEKSISTAKFNPATRTIVMPTWLSAEGRTNDEFNTFLAHEVGHALFTPADCL